MTAQPTRGGVPAGKTGEIESSLAWLREVLLRLRYGSVLITVHEDRITQIDVTEKTRLKPG